jgi:hypothetical protein
MIHKINIIVFAVILVTAGAILLFAPRPNAEEIEKNRLSPFPKFTFERYFSGDFTRELSLYFSDTVPARDNLTEISSWLKNLKGISVDGVVILDFVMPDLENPNIPVNPPGTPANTTKPTTPIDPDSSQPTATTFDGVIPEPDPPPVNDGAPEFANAGVMLFDGRALMITGWFFAGERYSAALNEYARLLNQSSQSDGMPPQATAVWSMLVPSDVEFYAPQNYREQFGIDQRSAINRMNNALSGDVTPVNVYSVLADRTNEEIFLRTDHHWSPLGAYYAAEHFAQVAEVPFIPLADYERIVIPDYVGSMFGFSDNNPTVRTFKEDFIYYKPPNQFTTTYYHTIAGQNPNVGVQGTLFMEQPLGDSYSIFMGGDAKITHIQTDVNNGRKLAVFKESMGNALIPFFTGSFEEIYVIDIRFFPFNAIDYLTERGVTDVLFATSMAMANDGNFVGLIESLKVQ